MRFYFLSKYSGFQRGRIVEYFSTSFGTINVHYQTKNDPHYGYQGCIEGKGYMFINFLMKIKFKL